MMYLASNTLESMNSGTCPQCKILVTSVLVEDVEIEVSRNTKWQGFSYLCKSCRTVLSVQINPLIIQDDTVRDVGRLLQDREQKSGNRHASETGQARASASRSAT